MSLSPDLLQLQSVIEGYARDFGLDFPEVRFEMLDYRLLNQVAAYDGFPTRYPYWRFGMEYERLSKSYGPIKAVIVGRAAGALSAPFQDWQDHPRR